MKGNKLIGILTEEDIVVKRAQDIIDITGNESMEKGRLANAFVLTPLKEHVPSFVESNIECLTDHCARKRIRNDRGPNETKKVLRFLLTKRCTQILASTKVNIIILLNFYPFSKGKYTNLQRLECGVG